MNISFQGNYVQVKDADFVEVHHKELGTALIVVSSVLIGISTVVVILRLISRIWILRTHGSDDWCAMGSMLTSVGMLASIILGAQNGMGKHWSNTNGVLGKIQLAVQVLYITSSGLVKLSLISLYHRIFPSLRIATIISAVFITLMTLTFIFVAIFQCHPIGSFWVHPTGGHSSCISLLIFWCDVAVVFLVTNILVMLLPLKPILDLQLGKRKKTMALILLCSTGFCTVVAASVRLAYVVHLYKGRDLSWDVAPIYFCSVVEISTALVASSIPTLRLAYLRCSHYYASHNWMGKKKHTKIQSSEP